MNAIVIKNLSMPEVVNTGQQFFISLGAVWVFNPEIAMSGQINLGEVVFL